MSLAGRMTSFSETSLGVEVDSDIKKNLIELCLAKDVRTGLVPLVKMLADHFIPLDQIADDIGLPIRAFAPLAKQEVEETT